MPPMHGGTTAHDSSHTMQFTSSRATDLSNKIIRNGSRPRAAILHNRRSNVFQSNNVTIHFPAEPSEDHLNLRLLRLQLDCAFKQSRHDGQYASMHAGNEHEVESHDPAVSWR